MVCYRQLSYFIQIFNSSCCLFHDLCIYGIYLFLPDAEIQITGLSGQSIEEYADNYLDSREKSQALVAKAKETGIYELLRIPIILLMLCVLYLETESLPRTKTDIVWDNIQMYKGRAEEKIAFSWFS